MIKFNPFIIKVPEEKTFFKLLFFKYDNSDAARTLNNLFASKDILSIKPKDLISLNKEFEINIDKDYRDLLISNYLKYYEFAISNIRVIYH